MQEISHHCIEALQIRNITIPHVHRHSECRYDCPLLITHTRNCRHTMLQFLNIQISPSNSYLKHTGQVSELRLSCYLIFSVRDYAIPSAKYAWFCWWTQNMNGVFNTLRPRQNGHHLPDDILKWIFWNENVWISIKISLKFVPRSSINNILALAQIMAWCRPGTSFSKCLVWALILLSVDSKTR